jgi:hypothetical protein
MEQAVAGRADDERAQRHAPAPQMIDHRVISQGA